MMEALLTTIGAGVLLVLGWAAQLHSRVSVLEKGDADAEQNLKDKFEDLKELINVQFNAQGQRLDRIERSMNGHLLRD
jgi:hypothetical protein